MRTKTPSTSLPSGGAKEAIQFDLNKASPSMMRSTEQQVLQKYVNCSSNDSSCKVKMVVSPSYTANTSSVVELNTSAALNAASKALTTFHRTDVTNDLSQLAYCEHCSSYTELYTSRSNGGTVVYSYSCSGCGRSSNSKINMIDRVEDGKSGRVNRNGFITEEMPSTSSSGEGQVAREQGDSRSSVVWHRKIDGATTPRCSTSPYNTTNMSTAMETTSLYMCGFADSFSSLMCPVPETPTADFGVADTFKLVGERSPIETLAAARASARQMMVSREFSIEEEHIQVTKTPISYPRSPTTASEKISAFRDIEGSTQALPPTNKIPNREFASVYPSYRLHPQCVNTVFCRLETTIPCFFTTNQGHKYRSTHVCSEPKASILKVRGIDYLANGFKTPSEDSLFALLGIDSLLQAPGDTKRVLHCSAAGDRHNFRNRLIRACHDARISDPFLLVINLVLPWGNLQAYFYRPDGTNGSPFKEDKANTGAERLWRKFLTQMDDVSIGTNRHPSALDVPLCLTFV